MLQTYEAVLNGDHIEWPGDGVGPIPRGAKVRVRVTLLEEPPPGISDEERGRRMAAALERIAAMPRDGLPDDPVQWQREIREDRCLPGRSD